MSVVKYQGNKFEISKGTDRELIYSTAKEMSLLNCIKIKYVEFKEYILHVKLTV